MVRVRWWRLKLYKILDVVSRYVVGWLVAHRESAALGTAPCLVGACLSLGQPVPPSWWGPSGSPSIVRLTHTIRAAWQGLSIAPAGGML